MWKKITGALLENTENGGGTIPGFEVDKITERVRALLLPRLPANEDMARALREVLSLLRLKTEFVRVTDEDINTVIDTWLEQLEHFRLGVPPAEPEWLRDRWTVPGERMFRPHHAHLFIQNSHERNLLEQGKTIILDKFGHVVHSWVENEKTPR